MNKKRKIILITTTFAMSSTVLGFAFLPKKMFRINADAGYTCPLPGSFVELDDVITEARSAGTILTNNVYQFRGTVTRRVGDIAYVQRVNQSDHYLYGLRVEGVSTYANSLQEGNVVDFFGGQVYLYQGVPSFKLTASTNATVKYSVNPTGYGPVVYQTYGEADENMYDSSYVNWSDGEKTATYACNRLVQIKI